MRAYIETVAGKYILLNIIMHIFCYAAVIMLFMPKFRYKKAVWNSLVAVLFTSVAVIAIINGNPFNFGIFVIAAGFAISETVKGRNEAELSFAFGTAQNIRTAILLAVSSILRWTLFTK